MELGLGQTREVGAYADQRLNLAKLGRPREDSQDSEPDLGKSDRPGLLGGCVRKTRNRRAVRKMKVGPSEPPCRRRLQTALSCFGPKGRGGER
jgi:hypothetical protein